MAASAELRTPPRCKRLACVPHAAGQKGLKLREVEGLVERMCLQCGLETPGENRLLANVLALSRRALRPVPVTSPRARECDLPCSPSRRWAVQVEQKYRNHFREHLDAEGNPVDFNRPRSLGFQVYFTGYENHVSFSKIC